MFDTTRVRLGISPTTFSLDARARRARSRRPEAVIAYSDAGLGGHERRVPRALPRAARPRRAGATRPRPILINNWEATYFDFDEERLLEIADRRRATSASSCSSSMTAGSAPATRTTRSLGDWFVDRRKLPDGIDGLAERSRRSGLDFGLWIEPEMVSARSRAVRGAPGLGGRRPRPAADREPPAARPRHVAPGDRRPPGRRPVRASSRARRSRTSNGT